MRAKVIMLKETDNLVILDPAAAMVEDIIEFRRQKEFLRKRALQNAALNSTCFSSIVTDIKGVIQIFNVGAEPMLGHEVSTRAKVLSVELGAMVSPGSGALASNAARNIEDIYELTCIRKNGSRFPTVVSVTTLRDAQDTIIGYLLIGTYNTAHMQTDKAPLRAEAMKGAISQQYHFFEDGLILCNGRHNTDRHFAEGRNPIRNPVFDCNGQYYRCGAGKKLTHINEMDKYDD